MQYVHCVTFYPLHPLHAEINSLQWRIFEEEGQRVLRIWISFWTTKLMSYLTHIYWMCSLRRCWWYKWPTLGSSFFEQVSQSVLSRWVEQQHGIWLVREGQGQRSTAFIEPFFYLKVSSTRQYLENHSWKAKVVSGPSRGKSLIFHHHCVFLVGRKT